MNPLKKNKQRKKRISANGVRHYGSGFECPDLDGLAAKEVGALIRSATEEAEKHARGNMLVIKQMLNGTPLEEKPHKISNIHMLLQNRQVEH